MKNKRRIGIAGIGGVGGFIGGLLARKYAHGQEVEIIFIATPRSAEAISRHGLKIHTGAEKIIARPHLVTADASEVPSLDVLIIAVKSYTLDEVLNNARRYVQPHTVIVPLLNGVDAKDRILSVLPGAIVAEGCIYILARRTAPGEITESGTTHKVYLDNEVLSLHAPYLEKLLSGAGIDCEGSDCIQKDTWEKFIYIAALASATAYYDRPIGGVLADPGSRETLVSLLREITEIAFKLKIPVVHDIFERTMQKMETLPYDATSSMHSDLKNGGQTEYLSLTGHPVSLGRTCGVATPAFSRIFEALQAREK